MSRILPTCLALLLTTACGRSSQEAPPAGKSSATSTTTAAEARAIAKEAYIYGFPLVDSYRIQYAYSVDKTNPEYKGVWNEVHSTARVYTPDDKAVQTPNSDTPYSTVAYDLRAEPLVLVVPKMDKQRYYSLQFIDLYTHNFAYVGSRTTGNDGATVLLAGPAWKGETPRGVDSIIRSETELGFVAYRTQLINASDLENVKKVQAGYTARPLSAFQGQPAPTPAPPIDFIEPLTAEQERTSPEFFEVLNFVLRFCPTVPSETDLMERFRKLGIGPHGTFSAASLSPEILQAVKDGMADAWKELDALKKRIDAGEVTSSDMFGTRAFLKNNYPYRMAAAVLGIYGNSKEEAMYPVLATDETGKPLSGSNKHVVRFARGQLPPANAFWSVTMYELPSSLLVANPINRYLINSPMLPSLTKDADGGLTIYVQNESPGKPREANWLPAPKGPFVLVMRLYWPKQEALDGTWKAPKVQQQ
jgi:hypothetical protein